MATVNASLSNATFYNVERFDVVQGEKFSLLLTDSDNIIVDFSVTNDPVLDIQSDVVNSQEVTASKVGRSRIIYLDKDDKKVKELIINVVESISDPAVSLDLSVGEEESK